MTIKFVLITLLSSLLLYALGQYRRSRPVAVGIIICCVAGIVLVMAPDLSTNIANLLGVGRGADLVIYLVAIVTLAGIFNLHLRIRASDQLVTELARAFAVKTAHRPE
jgi:small membrane protein